MSRELVIGSTSQIAQYPNLWGNNTRFITSRDIDLKYFKKQEWDRIYVSFADTRTFLKDYDVFYKTNVEYTLKVIDELKESCRNIVFFSTTELWNRHNGSISEQNIGNWEFDPGSFYIKSKEKITNILLEKEKYKNVIILFPFSFNAPCRKEQGFLFSKIFRSILNKEKIKIGNIKFYRDLIHPKYVIKEARNAEEHKIIGSGRLTYIYDFIDDLYSAFDMRFQEYFEEQEKYNFKDNRGIFWLNSKERLYTYSELCYDTINDLKNFKVVNND